MTDDGRSDFHISGIHHVVFVVSPAAFDATRHFYHGVLGLAIMHYQEGEALAFTDGQTSYWFVGPQDTTAAAPRGTSAYHHLAFRLGSAGDFDAALAALNEAGVEHSEIITEWGGRNVNLIDPNGITVELRQP